MNRLFTPNDVAKAIGVSESSMKRWCDRGLVIFSKTAGGHRRISLAAIIRFLKESGHSLIQPAAIGLPASVGQRQITPEQSVGMFYSNLAGRDYQACRQIVLDLVLSGHRLATICDEVVLASKMRLANEIAGGQIDSSHRSEIAEIAEKIVTELRSMVPPIDPLAPSSVGVNLDRNSGQDIHQMADIAISEIGINSISLGFNDSPEAIEASRIQFASKAVWISTAFSALGENELNSLVALRQLVPIDVPIFVGGNGLNLNGNPRLQSVTTFESVKDLAGKASALLAN